MRESVGVVFLEVFTPAVAGGVARELSGSREAVKSHFWRFAAGSGESVYEVSEMEGGVVRLRGLIGAMADDWFTAILRDCKVLSAFRKSKVAARVVELKAIVVVRRGSLLAPRSDCFKTDR